MNNNGRIDILMASSHRHSTNVYEYMITSGLTDAEYRVYTLLLSIARRLNKCYPTMEQLGQMVGKKRRSIQSIITSLAEQGLIMISKNRSETGKFENNVYVIFDDPSLFPEREESLAPTDQSTEQTTPNKTCNQLTTQITNQFTDNDTTVENTRQVDNVGNVDDTLIKAREIVEDSLPIGAIKTLLKACNGDVNILKYHYEHMKTKKNIDNKGKWLYNAVISNYTYENDTKDVDNTYEQAPRERLTTNTMIPKTTNKFNAFPQRNYSKEDYLTMEQRLLNRE